MGEALREMRAMMKRVPFYRELRSPVIASAMREHALFYARELCGKARGRR